jgi:hypothetical protein
MMTTTGDAMPGTATIGGVIAVARRNAENGSDLAIAASQVIAKRVALGVAAAINPLQADHTEFERMVPEKLEALSAVGMIMLKQSSQATGQITHFVSEAVIAATRATITMAGCSNPAALAAAQGRFAFGWWDQLATNLIAMGMMTLGMQAAIMAPIRVTVAANARRLDR